MTSTINSAIHFVKTFDPLQRPTQVVKDWLNDHPTTFKVVLIANHLLRTTMMTAFMLALPYSKPVNALICLGSTLFYRITIQGHCPYKLDMTSLFGAMSFVAAKDSIYALVNGIAAQSFLSSPISFGSLAPLSFYAWYVVITSEKKCSCVAK